MLLAKWKADFQDIYWVHDSVFLRRISIFEPASCVS